MQYNLHLTNASNSNEAGESLKDKKIQIKKINHKYIYRFACSKNTFIEPESVPA